MFEKVCSWLRSYGIRISPGEEQVLAARTRRTTIEKNTIIMQQGKSVDRLYFLNSGTVRLLRVHNTTDITIDFISWNVFVSTVVYLVNREPSPCALETLTETDAFYWELEDLLYLKEHTKVVSAIEQALLSRLLNWNQDREMDILSMTPEERYIKLMNTQPDVIRDVPLKFIASYLGIHQDSLSRIRHKLARAK